MKNAARLKAEAEEAKTKQPARQLELFTEEDENADNPQGQSANGDVNADDNGEPPEQQGEESMFKRLIKRMKRKKG